MRGVVSDEHVQPGFRRNCGVCGAGLPRVPLIAGLRAFWNGGLPTDAIHSDHECFARWVQQQYSTSVLPPGSGRTEEPTP